MVERLSKYILSNDHYHSKRIIRSIKESLFLNFIYSHELMVERLSKYILSNDHYHSNRIIRSIKESLFLNFIYST